MPIFCLFLGKKLKINSDKAILLWVRMYRKMGFFCKMFVEKSNLSLIF